MLQQCKTNKNISIQSNNHTQHLDHKTTDKVVNQLTDLNHKDNAEAK